MLLKQKGKQRTDMATRSRTIERFTFRFIVEEVNKTDTAGRILLYVASVYLQVRGSSRMHLIRRSRIPGSASQLEREARLGRINLPSLMAS